MSSQSSLALANISTPNEGQVGNDSVATKSFNFGPDSSLNPARISQTILAADVPVATQQIPPSEHDLTFRPLCDAAQRMSGNRKGSDCHYHAKDMSKIRKHQIDVHKTGVHWHPNCEDHIIGNKSAMDEHKEHCPGGKRREMPREKLERAYRNLYRKLYRTLPFPPTPYNYCLSNPNWKCWLYPNAQDLMQDRHVNPIDITDKMQYFDTGIPSAETSATDVDATSAPSSNTPTTSQPEARSPLTETPFDRWCRENLDSL